MSDVPSPKASRQSRPRWLDPKLFLGILLVLGSMAFGAQIIGNASTTTQILKVKPDADIGADEPIKPDMFEPANVRFTSADDAKKYLAPKNSKGEDAIKPNSRSRIDLKGGEFVPGSAIYQGEPSNAQQFQIGVSGTTMTSGLQPGDRVDLWLAPKNETSGTGEDAKANEAEMVASNLLVIAAPKSEDLTSGGAVTVEYYVGKTTNKDNQPFALEQYYNRRSQTEANLVKHK